MKKQLLFDFSKSLFGKRSFGKVALAVFTLLTAQSTFGQAFYSWTGTSDLELSNVGNWYSSALVLAPTAITSSDNYTVSLISPATVMTVFNSSAISTRSFSVGTGVTAEANANITGGSSATSSINGILNINSGATCAIAKLYSGNGTGLSGVINVKTGGTLSGSNVWRVGAVAGSTGTININGGTLTLGTAGSLALGYASTGILNINSGTVNVNYTAFTSLSITANGTINIDGGSMVIPGNQITAVQAFIDGGKIKTSGAALIAGKIISNTYDAGTDKTTVVTIAAIPLGVNDTTLDANNIVVYSQNQNIKIQSGNGILSDVKVYDLNGRLVAGKNNIGSNETSIALNASNAVYVVKVTTADGSVVTKKIVQ